MHGKILGTTEADLLRSYPTLRVEDLTAAWAYHCTHWEVIARDIAENKVAYI